ncbi:hypothetical protein [Nocardiopsis composta]|uniref:Lipoprotein n=1 Tax=Nocardiopsis composta TaxID=157465 RepID=A0A7W8QQA3_9ACTN|nr:hypothetical protein [Nocardiopsis composta]MBB5434638.1 hypothetical protein [Nocardiopsis composta]
MRPIMSAAVLLSAGLLAAGCGDEPPSPEPREDAKSASPATEESPSPAPTEEAAAEEEKEQEGVLGFWWSVRNSSDSPAVVSIQFSEEGKVSMLGDPGLESVEKGQAPLCAGEFDGDPADTPVDFTVTCSNLADMEAGSTDHSGSADLTSYRGNPRVEVTWDSGNVDVFEQVKDGEETPDA